MRREDIKEAPGRGVGLADIERELEFRSQMNKPSLQDVCAHWWGYYVADLGDDFAVVIPLTLGRARIVVGSWKQWREAFREGW